MDMETVEVASSPGSLSSPPHSPEQNSGNNSTIRPSSTKLGVEVDTPPRLTATGAIRKKPGPKPKSKDPNAPAPEKKTRKPRKLAEPKDPSAEPAPRKRRTKASLEAQSVPLPAKEGVQVVQQPPSPTLPTQTADLVTVAQLEPLAQPVGPVAQAAASPVVASAPRVLSNPEPIHNNPSLSHMAGGPSTPRPASSGQQYDPIRGGLIESKFQGAAHGPAPISPPLNRASASPSITSLIDPPSAANSTYPPQTTRLHQQLSVTSAPVSPAPHAARPGSMLPYQDLHQPPRHVAPSGPMTSKIDLDSDFNSAPRPAASIPMKKTNSASASAPSQSNAATPPVKPVRQKEVPPPLPTGSGLLSGTAFGPVPAGGATSTEPQGVSIWMSFPLSRTDNTINFAQEVEKTYGFAALHPKVAARKERLRQVTAAGAALEKTAGAGSTDDMSLDLSEPESNVEMGGMDDDGSGAGNGKKRRKRKQEEYDKEDDFIDDTELAWEQQALMAKDGFFVYSGPLVTEGDKPAVERADGTVKRGRGRGRGGTTRGDATTRGRGRGGGPGSRGGSTVRKPRVTKADRVQMEQEKLDREKAGQVMAGKQYGGPSL